MKSVWENILFPTMFLSSVFVVVLIIAIPIHMGDKVVNGKCAIKKTDELSPDAIYYKVLEIGQYNYKIAELRSDGSLGKPMIIEKKTREESEFIPARCP